MPVQATKAPTGTSTTVTTLEDTPYTLHAADFGFSDPNDIPPNAFLAVEITTLPASGMGVLALNGTPVVAQQFVPVTAINNNQLVFTAPTDANGSPYTSFTFQVRDDGGTDNGGVDTDPVPKTLTFNVTAMNDAPVRTAGSPTAINVNEDNNDSTTVTLGLSGLAYGPGGGSDESGQTLTYKITAIPSYITLWKADDTTQVTVNTTLTLAELQGLKYETVLDANGSGNLQWTVADNGGTANGGVDTLTETLAITVNAINDEPVRTNNGSLPIISANEDSHNTTTLSLGLSGVLYGPGGGSDESGQTLSYQLAAIPAMITVWKSDGTTQVTVGTTLTLTDLQGLKYKTLPNLNGFGYVTFNVTDDGGTANGGDDTLSQSVAVTINAVNDVPVRTAGSPSAINVMKTAATRQPSLWAFRDSPTVLAAAVTNPVRR